MNIINSIFWGEGTSDERFLPKVIERVLHALVFTAAKQSWEIYEPTILKSKEENFTAQVIDIAQRADGYNFCFIHTDADAINAKEKALPHKIKPTLEALAAVPGRCTNIIFVVPVTKIENWKISDTDALRITIGTKLTDQALGLNMGRKQLEQRADSKLLLQNAILAAWKSKNQTGNVFHFMAELDASLANNIRLQSLYQLASFRDFVADLQQQLLAAKIISPDIDAKKSIADAD
jgi:hypothetical protein